VKHGGLVLVDLHTAFEQLAIGGSPDGLGGWLIVVFPGKQQSDIDAPFHRRNQRPSLTAARGAVSVRNIDGLLGGREGDRLHK